MHASDSTKRVRKRILIVDDAEDVLVMLKYNLEREGFQVLAARTGEEALEKARMLPDLIILDVVLPQIDGWDVARQLKHDQRTEGIPIFFVTARDAEVDEIIGLELGAVDYLKKPISIGIFLARVRAAMRNLENSPGRGKADAGLIRLNGMEIDPVNYSVRLDGKEVVFAKREFELLSYLGQHPDRVMSRNSLLESVWGVGIGISGRTVDVHIRKIREKLREYARHIVTVKKVGYKFSLDRE
jgi:two-component system alkaline phosphatase synthesis response regulator PhoP